RKGHLQVEGHALVEERDRIRRAPGDRMPSHAYEEWALRAVEVGLVDPEGEVREVARVVVGAEHGVRLVRVHLAQVPHLVRARVRRALRLPLRQARTNVLAGAIVLAGGVIVGAEVERPESPRE